MVKDINHRNFNIGYTMIHLYILCTEVIKRRFTEHPNRIHRFSQWSDVWMICLKMGESTMLQGGALQFQVAL
jgi:hypothetical protein